MSTKEAMTAADLKQSAHGALAALGAAVIRVFHEVDSTHNVADYLKTMTVECISPGKFKLKFEAAGELINVKDLTLSITEGVD